MKRVALKLCKQAHACMGIRVVQFGHATPTLASRLVVLVARRREGLWVAPDSGSDFPPLVHFTGSALRFSCSYASGYSLGSLQSIVVSVQSVHAHFDCCWIQTRFLFFSNAANQKVLNVSLELPETVAIALPMPPVTFSWHAALTLTRNLDLNDGSLTAIFFLES